VSPGRTAGSTRTYWEAEAEAEARRSEIEGVRVRRGKTAHTAAGYNGTPIACALPLYNPTLEGGWGGGEGRGASCRTGADVVGFLGVPEQLVRDGAGRHSQADDVGARGRVLQYHTHTHTYPWGERDAQATGGLASPDTQHGLCARNWMKYALPKKRGTRRTSQAGKARTPPGSGKAGAGWPMKGETTGSEGKGRGP